MKRLILMFAAAASLATALPLGELAYAQGRGRDRGAERHDNRGGGDRGGGRRDDGRREDHRRVDEGRRGPPPAPPGRGRPREDDRRYEAPPRRYEEGPRRYEEPPPQSRTFAPPRRGGYLQEVPRGGPVGDYQRHRLRPPPRGYAWYRVGNGYALVSEADGRVFDVIPD